MNTRLLLSTAILLAILLLSMGNKNGRAASQNRGNTGAPGDETSLGQPKTCRNCHNQGPITASVAISVIDANGQAVSSYRPGEQYTASVKITASGTNLNGYGFQMIALKDVGNTDLDGFTDINPNNYKIASLTNGRTYAEHDNISPSNTFDVKWKAPVAGTGSVTFYAAGNGVNSNGGTGGDGSGLHSLKLTEASSVATGEPVVQANPLKVFPNPIQQDAVLDLSALPAGDCRVKAFNVAGKLVWEQSLAQAQEKLLLPAAAWAPGLYFIQAEGADYQLNVKAIKL